ncbi:ATP-binding protein [Anaeromyxobacter sp. Red801]|uniref:ATP-binding protein n=1 Tax=Anaeromyxobacter sp. Red801 TaxID=3411632 RepID=UPI003BA078FE
MSRATAPTEPLRLDFAASDERTGFRLARLEVYNWGTFHGRAWHVDANGRNTLLTGDVGSGKSTLVDALTTLLVAPQKLAYNRAAGADARERTARSYVLGHWKAERGDGSASRPVALRDASQYSVILGVFENEGFSETVTLAQVFWLGSAEGQPERLYVVAGRRLSITEHFSGFGTEIGPLKKRLRTLADEVHESFPGYAAAFRRRFGLANDQALELFHQTVSMKTVGNLTDFVRQHMLQPFPVEDRIGALIHHFDDLVRAHDAVLKAKAQIASLQPLVADCDRMTQLRQAADLLAGSRRTLPAWFAGVKRELLLPRVEHLEAELAKLQSKLDEIEEKRRSFESRADGLKGDIAASGGERLEQIRREVERLTADRDDRARRAAQYDGLASDLGLMEATEGEQFAANVRAIQPARDVAERELASVENELTETRVQFRELQDKHAALAAELDSLRRRRSNIPARHIALRSQLCEALALDEATLPFAGELIQVHEDERAWEGAAERLLHGFGMSLLVPEDHYARVAEWVDRTQLGQHLVYYRVRAARSARLPDLEPRSLVRKLSVKPDSDHYEWLVSELARRFDYACCDDLGQFRREKQAVTRAGQVKGAGERHEKDDRHAIDDRSRYVLGWTNDAKVAALATEKRAIEVRLGDVGAALAARTDTLNKLRGRLDLLVKLAVFQSFRDLDWRGAARDIEALEEERRRIESASDLLRVLRDDLANVLRELKALAESERELAEARGTARTKLEGCRTALRDCEDVLGAHAVEERKPFLDALDAMRPAALEDRAITLESAAAREREFVAFLGERAQSEQKNIDRLAEKIVKAMEAYRNAYPGDAKEADASLDAADEYRGMLGRLLTDDLPRFERRFKEALNENTIREIAGFHAQLQRERQDIKERIEEINGSLRAIDFNPNRYIVLEASPSTDAEVREFQGDLRACIEGALTGSEDATYSEAKFVQVKRIIDRFRGREGLSELDRKWTRKVTDVRNWSSFSASERWREDDREHEHYSDSGGKSGGQKEKLAYTVLAASLAYQFGLKFGETRSRSFRFVTIDEAFARGSDDSASFALELFKRLNLQLLVVTPLQKIHVIEPYVASVAFVHNQDGRLSMIRNLTIEEYRAERAARTA